MFVIRLVILLFVLTQALDAGSPTRCRHYQKHRQTTVTKTLRTSATKWRPHRIRDSQREGKISYHVTRASIHAAKASSHVAEASKLITTTPTTRYTNRGPHGKRGPYMAVGAVELASRPTTRTIKTRQQTARARPSPHTTAKTDGRMISTTPTVPATLNKRLKVRSTKKRPVGKCGLHLAAEAAGHITRQASRYTGVPPLKKKASKSSTKTTTHGSRPMVISTKKLPNGKCLEYLATEAANRAGQQASRSTGTIPEAKRPAQLTTAKTDGSMVSGTSATINLDGEPVTVVVSSQKDECEKCETNTPTVSNDPIVTTNPTETTSPSISTILTVIPTLSTSTTPPITTTPTVPATPNTRLMVRSTKKRPVGKCGPHLAAEAAGHITRQASRSTEALPQTKKVSQSTTKTTTQGSRPMVTSTKKPPKGKCLAHLALEAADRIRQQTSRSDGTLPQDKRGSQPATETTTHGSRPMVTSTKKLPKGKCLAHLAFEAADRIRQQATKSTRTLPEIKRAKNIESSPPDYLDLYTDPTTTTESTAPKLNTNPSVITSPTVTTINTVSNNPTVTNTLKTGSKARFSPVWSSLYHHTLSIARAIRGVI